VTELNGPDRVVIREVADPGAPLWIGSNVSVGHGAILHGCTIEDGALIGMGAVVMNGAVIGAGALLAAGTVVTQGTEIPAGSLVAGVPATIKRTLDHTAIQTNIDNARRYTERARSHRDAIGNR
jgi:carbonic anhydrase/acetyltransferase-like protein (isoleucine patch superfamily)